MHTIFFLNRGVVYGMQHHKRTIDFKSLEDEKRLRLLSLLSAAKNLDVKRTDNGQYLVTYRAHAGDEGGKQAMPVSPPSQQQQSKTINKPRRTPPIQHAATSIKTLEWVLRRIDEIYNHRYQVYLFYFSWSGLFIRSNVTRGHCGGIFTVCI